MPFIALAYFFLWFLPPFTSLRGLWYTTFYCLFQALATVSRWAPLPGSGLLEPHCCPVATLQCVCVARVGVLEEPTDHTCSPVPGNLPFAPLTPWSLGWVPLNS